MGEPCRFYPISGQSYNSGQICYCTYALHRQVDIPKYAYKKHNYKIYI